MSEVTGYPVAMKNRMKQFVEEPVEEIVTVFGEARLIRVNGKLVLRGGSMADRTEAMEWLATFMPEAMAGMGHK